MTAEANDTTRTTLALPGLEADNLLAFLALLGLLRALDIAKAEWRARASWIGVPSHDRIKGTPVHGRPHALLHVSGQGLDYEAVGKAVMSYRELAASGLVRFRSKLHLIPRQTEEADSEDGSEKNRKKTSLKPSQRAEEYRQLAESVISEGVGNSGNWIHSAAYAEAINVVSSLARLVPGSHTKGSNEYDVEESPLQLPSGNMSFLGTIKSLFVDEFRVAKKKGVETHIGVGADHIIRSISTPWEFAEKGASLRLSPQEDVRYALRSGDPSPEGASDERGATFLGAIGLLSLCLASSNNLSGLSGYTGNPSYGTFSWPLWASDIQLSHTAIISLMRHPELLKDRPDGRKLSTYGLVQVMRCDRFIQNPDTGNYGNVSAAVGTM